MKESKITITYTNETEKYQIIGISDKAEILYSGTKSECIDFYSRFVKEEYIENTPYSSIEVIAPKEKVTHKLLHTEYEEEDYKWLDDFFN